MIPKIQYGDALPLVIELDYPPRGMGEDEQFLPKQSVTVSQTGVRQISTDYVEAVLPVMFAALSEQKYAALRAFYLSWAALGRSFRYYDDKDATDFRTYELSDLKFQPKRTGIAGENKFTRAVSMEFTRVTDNEVAEFMEAEILNDQEEEAEIDGLLLDSSLYSSAKIFFELRRQTSEKEIAANGWLTAIYNRSTNDWSITPKGTYDGDDHGVDFGITADGQVIYVSDELAGSNYSGTLKVKNLTF